MIAGMHPASLQWTAKEQKTLPPVAMGTGVLFACSECGAEPLTLLRRGGYLVGECCYVPRGLLPC